MGAEQSTGAAPPPPQWRDESLALGAADGTSLQQQVAALQQRVRELELAVQHAESAAGADTSLRREWLDVLEREPVVGRVQLTPQTCAVVDRLFAALDVNGDGTIDAKDMPTSKRESDIRGRAVSLFKPLSDYLVGGEMSPADLRRALASRASRRLVKPSGEDTLAGWLARIQVDANGWVQRTVLEVLGDPAAASVEARAPEAISAGIAFDRHSADCTSLTAVALGFSNLGWPTTLDDLFATARLPLWTVQYSRMSLAEAFHIARAHAETQGLGCYVSMLHARPGAAGLADFRQKIQAVATQAFKGESVGVVLLEASTALGTRSVEGEDSQSTIHATLVDSMEGDEVVLLDTQPKRFGLRWSCNIERLHLACCSLAAHDHGHPCGGIVSLSRTALHSGPEYGSGQDIELLAAARSDPDCFSRPAPWLPKLPVLSSQVPCRGLVTLCAGLAAAEQRNSDGELRVSGWPQVEALCDMLNLPIVRILEVEQTLSELADLAVRWVKMRSLPVVVAAMHCDDLLPDASSIDSLLVGWAAMPAETRPTLMVQFDGAQLKTDDEDAAIRMAIVVAYDAERQVVTFAEASVRHHACTWKTPVSKLWDACSAVGSFGRTGGILSLSASVDQSTKLHKRALGDCHHEPMLHTIELPQFTTPIAATGLTSVAFALEALFRAASLNDHLGDAEDAVRLPGNLRRPVSVDDIISLTVPVCAANDSKFSMAEAYSASAAYVQKRNLPVRVDAIFFDGMTDESSFKEMIRSAVHATREVLVLHFAVGAARGISTFDGLGHAAIVAGFDENTDELLLADVSPKVYRGEWHAPLSTIYKACCNAAPSPNCRPRGAIRYALLSRAEVQSRISQHATSSKGMGSVAPLSNVADNIVSTHAVIKTLKVAGSVQWSDVPQSRLRALKAVALAMTVAGTPVTVSQLVRVCGLPAQKAHTPQWVLSDLAAIARLYITNAGLDLTVQAVQFTGSGNSFDQFRREMERHHLAADEIALLAFQPSVAHGAPELQSNCDYALVSYVDITAGMLELTDMNAKVNCERWACKLQLIYDAINSNPRPPSRSKGATRSVLPSDSLGMIRICSKNEDVAERMILDRLDEAPLSLLSLPGVSPEEVSHGISVLQAAFSSSLHCPYDVFESLFDVDDVISQNLCLPELRDRALICAHRQPELHHFRIDMVFCENEQCEGNDFSLEMQRHSEAVGLGSTEAIVVQFDSARLFGAADVAKNLHPFDWAMIVAAGPTDVTLALFDGAQHSVSTRTLYAACAAHHPTSRRAMGFFRIAMVTAAPVNAKRSSTVAVDGPIAWALHGDRIIASPPPPEPAPADPDPILKFRRAIATTFPKRETREQIFQRLDTNGNGRISVSEVDDAVDDLWPSFAHTGSIIYAFRACDADGNGVLTRREFATMVRSLAYFAQLHEVWNSALTDDTRFDILDFKKGIKSIGVETDCTEDPINTPVEFKMLASKVSFEDPDVTVPVHKFCAWMARRHDRHDGDWAADRYIYTENRMVKSAEYFYTHDESALGSAPCVPIIATIVAPEFSNPLPCTSLVAIGVCCDALSSLGTGGSSDRTPRRPTVNVDSIYRSVEIGISQILGLKTSKKASLGGQLFHRRAPSAAVQSNVSIGIEKSRDIANRLFAESQIQLCAETQYFQRGAASEKSFNDFLRESRGRQTGEDRELAVLFYNAQVTHAVSGLGGCSAGILVDYNEEASMVLIADMEPKRFGRFWSCSTRRLYHGCYNNIGERTYGVLRIRCGSAVGQRVIPDKKPSDMNGERLRWRRAIICVRFGVRLMKMSVLSKSKHEALVHWQQLPELSQNLPCAGLVGMAYALSALGYPTSVSSIVSHCRLPISVLLMPTLTLGQMGTIAQQYIIVRNLPLKLVTVFFDTASVTAEHFKEALTTVGERNARDQLLLNFDGEVARANHGATQRNGWGLLSRLDATEVEICDAMGTSAEAGVMWKSPFERLFAALCERDSCTKRARGAIHISGPKADSPADFDTVAGLGRSEAVPSVEVVHRWASIWPPNCDATYSPVQPGTQTQDGLPCHNLTALSMALAALDAQADATDEGALAAAGTRHGPNQIMQRLGLPVLLALNGSMSLAETASIAAAYIQACGLPIQVELIHFDMGAAPLNAFARELERVHAVRVTEQQLAHEHGNTMAKSCSETHIVAFDVDRMHGRFNLAPGETHFGVLLDYLADTESLVVADPCPSRFTGLWRSRLDNAYAGLTARSATGRAHGMLRLVRTDGDQECAAMALTASVVKPHSAGVLESQ